MKKVLAILLAAMVMVFSLAACRGADASTAAPASEPAAASTAEGDASTPAAEATEPAGDYKIGIITGTVSQGEEEFQAAQNMLKKFGPDKIVTATYPDKFNDEIETTIANVVEMASDPAVKAIVFVQAVPGATAAIEKARETRPDLLFVAGVAQEAPATIAAAADVVLLADEPGMGTAVIEQAAAMGATTFVHYSFPRHLSIETIAERTILFKENCARLGIEYVEATAPDPTGDAGVSGAQQFIISDVPTKVAEYGTDTAFFSTNCSMQEPLIRSVLEQGAIFPQQCCPSPFHGYPNALGIDVAGHEGDTQYMLDQITAKIDEGGNTGRMSTWPVAVNMLMVEAGVNYAIEFCEGRTNGAHDDAVIRTCVEDIVSGYGASAQITTYETDATTLDNFYLILADFYTF